MLQAADAVVRYLRGKSEEDFLGDEILRDAVERRTEIIGEAARGISAAFQAAHPQIPWRKITATRHVLAHDYDRVNPKILWTIATGYVPALLEQLRLLVPPPPPDPEPDA
jgi:uncharacterized protein with HEPN domain